MAFELTKVSYSGKIVEVTLGQGNNTVVVGGENCYPFHAFEGSQPNMPLLAMEVWDSQPEDWPAACSEPFTKVLGDPAAWAKKCVEQYGAQAIVLQLKSTDPNGADASPESASATVGKVLAAIKVPLIIWGSANPHKDADVLKRIAEDHQGKHLLLGPVAEENHKAVGAAALAYGHQLIASSPIDVNLAKQLNILMTNLGIGLDRLIIDPTTGGLGYGLEYSYSVMERIRMAALIQGDDKLVLPMINNVGNEVWKSKEAKLSDADAPDLGDSSLRGVLMEACAAVSFAVAGSDILILRHPRTVELMKGFLAGITAPRGAAAVSAKVDRPKVAALSAAPKPAVAPKPAAVPAPAAKPAVASPAPAAKPVAPVAAAVPAPPAPVAAVPAAAPAVDLVAAQKEAQAKQEAAALQKAKAEAQAKAQAEAKAKAEEEAAAKAHEDKKLAEAEAVAALRLKRIQERETMHKAQHAPTRNSGEEYGKDREPGTAGPDAIYIVRSLERWSLRGDGVLKHKHIS